MLFKKLLKNTDPAYLNAISQASTIGLHMVSGILAGTAIGYFLDKWLGTDPWLLIIFAFAGIVAGFKNVYVDTKRLLASQERPPGEQKPRGKGEETKSDADKTPPTD